MTHAGEGGGWSYKREEGGWLNDYGGEVMP